MFEIWMLGLVQVFDMLLIQVLGVCCRFEILRLCFDCGVLLLVQVWQVLSFLGFLFGIFTGLLFCGCLESLILDMLMVWPFFGFGFVFVDRFLMMLLVFG